MKNTKVYHELVQKMRTFFLNKGFLEVPTQSRLSILAACENPHSITTFEYQGQIWPLPQTGQIVEWSVRDESLHSKAGCWIYRTLLSEQPELDTPQLTQAIYEACDLSVKLEFDFIDKAFEMGNIEGLNKEQLKNFIKERANQKLVELGYSAIYNDIDPNLLKQMEWFGHLTSGKTHQDFFANRVTDYSKSTADWSDL